MSGRRVRDALIYSSPRRKPGSCSLFFLDSGFRRNDMSAFNQRLLSGFTLVEMVVAIVIISVGLAGVLLAFNTSVRSSADPLIHKQMLAVAEEMMEEILLKPYAVSGTAPSNSLTACTGASPASRVIFDDVSDYSGYQTAGICSIDGDPVVGLEAYSLTVFVNPAASLGSAANGGVLDNGKVKKVTVTVTHGAEHISLNGWRTWYACELPTVCPP